jgi:hypothetical protein
MYNPEKLAYCKPGNFRGSFIFAIFAVTLEAVLQAEDITQ